ncbi:amidohydrolase family protein [Piscibacillus sp. B03]|uniref:amidohydrolase family protein n=1 Tax=Piscibacillus sp. B03 TaxID=3457430 RepID=UPI003FCC36F0
MSLLLKNGQILDVETGEIAEGSILIEGDRIVEIGDIHIEADQIIDLKGQYVIPGLIDMHCHIKEGFAHLFTAAGVTTVRNTAGNVIELRDMIDAPPQAHTPRVYSADRLIDGPPGLWGPTSPYSLNVTDPNEARSEVRRQAQQGTDFIKVYGWLSPEAMEAVTDEASQLGLEVICDLIHSSQVNALQAVEMGIKWFEHNSGVIQAIYPGWTPSNDEEFQINWENPNVEKIREVCQELIKYNVNLCPTTVVFDLANQAHKNWLEDDRFTNNTLQTQWTQMTQHADALKSQLGTQTEYIKRITKTFYDLGGTVVAGTDTPGGVWTYPGMALHQELKLLVDSGLTELQALQCATDTAAKAMENADIGTISKGKIADLLILNSNPLTDIRHTRDIDFIIKGGKAYTQDELIRMQPDEETLKYKQESFLEEFDAQMVD